MSELDGYTRETFAHGGITRPVYWPDAPAAGPAVLVCHELPGMTPEFLGFAEHLRAAGFRVVMPHLLGDVGRPMTVPYLARGMSRVCIAREFKVLASHRQSPIAGWLLALVDAMRERLGCVEVGAVGMCFSGNFAIGLLLHPQVTRAVASQPSLPFALLPGRARALHLEPEAIPRIAARLTAPAGDARLMALRFTHDRLCPGARFDTLRETFPEGLRCVEIDSGPGNPNGHSRRAHSVLTVDLIDAEGQPTASARDEVVAFLGELKA